MSLALRTEGLEAGYGEVAVLHGVDIVVPANRITAILNGSRGITADTALRLSRYLGTSAEFWVNLQTTYELRVAEIEAGKQIEKRVTPRSAAA